MYIAHKVRIFYPAKYCRVCGNKIKHIKDDDEMIEITDSKTGEIMYLEESCEFEFENGSPELHRKAYGKLFWEEVTTHWLCLVCGDPDTGYGQVEHDASLDGKAVGPPKGWVRRAVVYNPDTPYESLSDSAGICPNCKDLSNDEAYNKCGASHAARHWRFADES